MSHEFDTAMRDEDPPEDEQPPDLDTPRLVDPRTQPARFHHLRAAGLSGAHALHSFQGDVTDTLSKRLGSGAHALLLGKPCELWNQPSKASVERRAKVMLKIRNGSTEPLPPLTVAPRSGADWQAFVAAHPGAVILNAKEMASARRIVDAIKDHPIAGRLLAREGMIFERSIIWAQNGRQRQTTPDARDAEINCEVKTTRCAAPVPFARDVAKLCYHAQVADQRAAIRHETGRAPRHSYVIAVENSRPHVVQVYEVVPATLDKGDQLLEIWLDKLQVYEATNQWGGYSQRIEPLEITDPFEPTIADPDWLSDDKDGVPS